MFLLKAFSVMWADLKTYLKVKVLYKKRHPNSTVLSYVNNDINILGQYLNIRENVFISAAVQSIGDGTYIGNNSSIFECDKIGKFCSISHGVKIGLSNHPLDHISTNALFYNASLKWVNQSTFNEQETKRCTIGNDVLISANATVLNGVKIGDGAVIGAGAFVNQDVPPYSIVAGMPAKVIRYRFDDEIVSKMLQLSWWDQDIALLKEKQSLFNDPETFLKSFE